MESPLVSRRRSVFVRVWRSGILQSSALDVSACLGLASIGVGIYQLSPAGVWIYVGVVLIVVPILLGLVGDRERRARPVKADES